MVRFGYIPPGFEHFAGAGAANQIRHGTLPAQA